MRRGRQCIEVRLAQGLIPEGQEDPKRQVLLVDVGLEGIHGQAVDDFEVRCLLLGEGLGLHVERADHVGHVEPHRDIAALLEVIAGLDQAAADRGIGAKTDKGDPGKLESYAGGDSGLEECTRRVEGPQKGAQTEAEVLELVLDFGVDQGAKNVIPHESRLDPDVVRSPVDHEQGAAGEVIQAGETRVRRGPVGLEAQVVEAKAATNLQGSDGADREGQQDCSQQRAQRSCVHYAVTPLVLRTGRSPRRRPRGDPRPRRGGGWR